MLSPKQNFLVMLTAALVHLNAMLLFRRCIFWIHTPKSKRECKETTSISSYQYNVVNEIVRDAFISRDLCLTKNLSKRRRIVLCGVQRIHLNSRFSSTIQPALFDDACTNDAAVVFEDASSLRRHQRVTSHVMMDDVLPLTFL